MYIHTIYSLTHTHTRARARARARVDFAGNFQSVLDYFHIITSY